MSSSRPRKALIIGGGPVGALTALSLHRRGWDVELWDMREDPRGQIFEAVNQRSINLNISNRGLEALKSVDPSLAEMLLRESIPMKGRMIHHLSGAEESQLYDPYDHQTGYSISRPILNQKLIEALPSDSIKFRFNTKLGKIDFRKRLAYGISVEKRVLPGQEDDDGRIAGDGKVKELKGDQQDREGTVFDLVVGCDGTWSKVRTDMMRVQRMEYSQSFIQHAYIELHMPPDPTKSGGFRMDPNHLHIWPRHSLMLIGLPNLDGSFTLTLFAPFAELEPLKTREAATAFLKDNFRSAWAIVDTRQLVDDFLNNPRGNLVETHVLPTAWSSHAILIGDASHSMVPFYGQGLNCGLEDVRILNSYLEEYKISPNTSLELGQTDPELEIALAAYSAERDKDLVAIRQLAKQNYVEMRSKVLSPLHLLRRRIDYLLQTLLPSKALPLSLTDPFPSTRVKGWTSLYHMVTFRADIPYHVALEREKWQSEVVKWLSFGVGSVGVLATGYLGWMGWGLVQRELRRR